MKAAYSVSPLWYIYIWLFRVLYAHTLLAGLICNLLVFSAHGNVFFKIYCASLSS